MAILYSFRCINLVQFFFFFCSERLFRASADNLTIGVIRAHYILFWFLETHEFFLDLAFIFFSNLN